MDGTGQVNGSGGGTPSQQPTSNETIELPPSSDQESAPSEPVKAEAMEVDTVETSEPPKEGDSAPTEAAKPTKPAGISALKDIVMGSSSPKKKAASPPAKAKKGAKEAAAPRSRGRGKKVKGKPELVTKKDRDHAQKVLKDAVDLLDYLPREDCMFLAEKFWIITGQHLKFALTSEEQYPVKARGSDKATLKQLLIEKLQRPNEVDEPPEEPPVQEQAIAAPGYPSLQQAPAMMPGMSMEGGGIGSAGYQKQASGGYGGQSAETAANESLYGTAMNAGYPPYGYVYPTGAMGGMGGMVDYGAQLPMNAMPDPGASYGVPPMPQPIPGMDLMPQQEKEQYRAPGPIPALKQKKRKLDIEPEEDPLPEPIQYPELSEQEAEDKVKHWLELISSASSSSELNKEKFPLDGPLQFVLPLSVQTFMKAAQIKTLHDFLSLRKTETGAIVGMFDMWRKKCRYQDVALLSISRYLTMIQFRIDTIFGATEPVTSTTRLWLDDDLGVLTETSRSFLIGFLNLYTSKEFLDMRTKDISDALVDWREKNDLPALRGSGKVAMVSGWKAIVRDCRQLDKERGNAQDNITFAELERVMNEQEEKKAESENKPEAAEEKKEEKVTVVNPMLYSPTFLERVLGPTISTDLASVGITTAQMLIDNYEKALVPASKYCDAQFPSARDALTSWMNEVQTRLENTTVTTTTSSSGPSLQKSVLGMTGPGEPPGKKARYSPYGQPRKPVTMLKDPIDAVSDMTQVFLKEIGILTAEQFLASRTSDIAALFVKWRDKKGMAPLRGLGSIASVSGWKASCRKAAKEMGMADLVDLEPANKSAWSSTSKPTKKGMRGKVQNAAAKAKGSNEMSHPQLLGGESRKLLYVQSSEDADVQYRFELSCRQVENSVNPGVFVTFKGAGAPSSSAKIESKDAFVTIQDGERKSPTKVPLLQEAGLGKSKDKSGSSDYRQSFSTLEKGIVMLGDNDIAQLHSQDLSPLMQCVKSFVFKGSFDSPVQGTLSQSNVGIAITGVGAFNKYLHLEAPMERGQTVSLKLPSATEYLNYVPEGNQEEVFRMKLLLALQSLSSSDTAAVLKFMDTDLIDQLDLLIDFAAIRTGAMVVPNIGDLVDKCQRRQRLQYLSRAAVSFLEDPSCLQTVNMERLYFWRSVIFGDPVHSMVPLASFLKTGLVAELEKDIMSFLHMDLFFSSQNIKSWCPVFHSLLRSMMEKITDHYASAKVAEPDSLRLELKNAFSAFYDRDLKIEECVLRKDQADGAPDLIACVKPDSEDVFFGTVASLSDGASAIASTWYKERMTFIAMKLVTAFAILVEPVEFDAGAAIQDYEKLSSLEFEYIDSWFEKSILGNQALHVMLPKVDQHSIRKSYQPASFQFFLGIVWPLLRKYGWRLQVGESPSDLLFAGPKATEFIGLKLPDNARKIRANKREKLSADTANLGFGPMPKIMKRLFSRSVFAKDAGEAVEKVDEQNEEGFSTKDLFSRFLLEVKARIEVDDRSGILRAESVVSSLKKAYENFADQLKFSDDIDSSRETQECEVLLRFLLLVPDAVKQAGLSEETTEQVLSCVQELSYFMCSNYKQILPNDLHPAEEVYTADVKIPPPSLGSKLRSQAAADSKQPDSSVQRSNIVDEEDKKDITEFHYLVLSHAKPIYATEDDAQKRGGRVQVGHSGIGCRFCSEGRYFFSTIDSLMSCPITFEKHLMKCAQVSEEVKAEIRKQKDNHAAQRKNLSPGSTHGYFVRLWDRLQVDKNASTDQAHQSTTSETETKNNREIEFTDHLEILGFLRSSNWSDISDLQTAINQYYNCLDYGGRIYQTPSMPDHFSSEWLLAKVVPKKQGRKKVNIPG